MKEVSELYQIYGRRIHAYLLRLSSSEELAAECTQETFCRILTAITTYRGDGRPLTWLIGIARNVYREEIRKRSRQGELGADFEAAVDRNPGPEQLLLASERWSDIQAALNRMPPSYREVLVLREMEGLSHGEIAQIMEQSPNWVRVTHFRARAKFRELYGEKGEHYV